MPRGRYDDNLIPADAHHGDMRSELEVIAVSKSFRHEGRVVQALTEVSLTVGAGAFVSIIGPSGCGKSTLFNIIAGLSTPDGGKVLVQGHEVSARGGQCVYMPQKDLLFPWRRILDNTILGLEIQGVSRNDARERARPLFTTFGLAGFEEYYPFQLSGGMRQRVALLRTVVQGRSVLLLDEPFGALDSLTRTEMQAWLSEVWEAHHWTVLLVTHDIREATFLSDRVYVMSQSPGRMRTVVDVELPRPRTLETLVMPEFASYEGRLLRALRGELGNPLGDVP